MTELHRKYVIVAVGLVTLTLFYFRRELMPFFFHESPLKEFEFRRPPPTLDHLTKAQGAAPTSGKTPILIEGVNFGTKDSVIHVSIGTYYCEDVLLVSDSKLTCSTPPGVGKDLAVIVVVDGLASAKPIYFSYDPPSIQQISATSGPTSGRQHVTITGINFGPKGTDVTAYIGDHEAPQADWLSPTAVEILTPKGSGKNNQVYVVIGGQKNEEKVFYHYDAPYITSIGPETGPTTGGIVVSIRGGNFGPRFSIPTASIGDKSCIFTTWRNENLLECSLPYGVGKDKTVRVTVASQTSPEDVKFSYDAPVVSTISPLNGPVEGKSIVTIMGTNFGHMGDPAVKFSSGACNVQSVSDVEIVCETPPGKAGTTNVVVSVGGQQNSPPAVWYYGVSEITSIEPAHGSAVGGYPVTIKGNMLGASESDVLSVTIGELVCRDTEWKSMSEIICIVPRGIGKSKVIIQLPEARVESWFTYDDMELKITSARFLDIDTLEVKGTNFEKEPGIEFPYANCFVNSRLSKPSEGTIVCEVREEKLGDMAKDLSITAVLGSITSKRFELPIWSLKPPIPLHGPTETSVIEIPIPNFPPVSKDKRDWITVELNEKSADVTGGEPGKIFVALRAVQKSSVAIEVKVGETSLGTTSFSYDPPKVSSATIKDQKLLVLGSNFGAVDAAAKFTFTHIPPLNTTEALECTSISVDHKKINCGVPTSFDKTAFKVKLEILGASFDLRIL